MVGIRVRGVPKNAKEKHLKIHFSKPEHGGGRIKKIYYPLFNNDAVILFEDKRVIETILQEEQLLGQHAVEVQALPEHMVYSTMDAKLEDAASVIVQVTPQLRDEMEYAEMIKVIQEKDETISLRGNWFQLEWAWHYIDCFMQQQEVIQHEISQQPQRYAGQPMEIDASNVPENLSKSSQHRISATDIDTSKRNSSKERAHFESSLKIRELTQSSAKSGYDGSEIPSLSYRGESASARINDEADIHHRYRDPKSYTEGISDPVTDSGGLHALKTNISDSYRDPYDKKNYSYRSNHSDSDDEEGLHGRGHSIPSGTMHSLGSSDMRHRRSDDENSTFRDFSGLDSPPQVTPEKSGERISLGNSSRSDSAQRENNTSVDSHTSLSSSYAKSMSFGSSGKESFGKSGKQSLDAVDHSLGLNKPKLPGASAIPDRYEADQLCKTFDIRGVKVTIYHGDLTKEETDAIVNAANEQLEHYGGIAYAIGKARGLEMDRECRDYIRNQGNLKTTHVTHTSGGGDIKSANILHAAGPMWLSERYKDKFTFQLTSTFLNCLEYAQERLWIRSIALPVISSGVYGAPLDICVRCFLDAVLIFTRRHGEQQRLTDIRLVNNDAESTVTSIVLVDTLLDQGIEVLTADAEAALTKHKTSNRELNIPRGRPEGASDFLKTYHPSFDAGYNLTSKEKSPVSDKLSSVSRRRSSSMSRMTEKKKSEYGEIKKYDEATGKFMAQSEENKTSANNTTYKPRGRAGSFGTKTGTKSQLRNTGSGQTSARPKESTTTPRSSTTALTTADKIRKSTPKIKPTLLTSDKIKSLKTPSPKKSDSLGLRTSDESGANMYGGKSKGSYQLHSDTSEDEEFGLRSLPANVHSHSFREKFLKSSGAKPEVCAICLDDVRNPQLLNCGHKFCSLCIGKHFKTSRPSCPTCGKLFGKVIGDQPRDGRMTYITDRNRWLPGYEDEDGMIIITYTFPNGIQESCHPQPGKPYKGLERKAFLPNCVEGRQILRLLRKAFDNRLVFTIGDSRTRGESGLLTWNDIHHKTSVGGGPTRFGYPDQGYLKRVKDELAVKGITDGR